MTKLNPQEKTIDQLTEELDQLQEHLEAFYVQDTVNQLKGLYGVNLHQLRQKSMDEARPYIEWMTQFNERRKQFRMYTVHPAEDKS